MERTPRVLLVSKPIAPPYTDGSVCIVRDLAGSLQSVSATVLTTTDAPAISSHVRHARIYARRGSYSPALSANARVLRFLMLTGLRISEAQKGHQDGDRWIVPAAISKNKKPHWVHLTAQAKAQLPLPATTPTNVQGWTRRWCERKEITPAFTPHDCRRTAATRMQDDRLGADKVQPFIVERVLNHTLEGVMAVYNHAEYEGDRIDAAEKLEQAIIAVIAEGRPKDKRRGKA